MAVCWTRAHLARIKDGGVWVIPRSMVAVRVISHKQLEVEIMNMDREPMVVNILRTLGWLCKPVTKEQFDASES